VDGLFATGRFAGFGPDRLAAAPAPLERVSAGRAGPLRERLRKLCPRRPGVYGMLDDRGVLVYVGKAKSLRSRLLSYFRADRGDKAARILGAARTIVWEPSPSEFAALLRELELIRRWRPRYNVQGVPGRQRVAYLCLGRGPAPYAFATRTPTGKELAVFGPLPGGAAVRQCARRLNDCFRLRDCPQSQSLRFAEQRELFPLLEAPGCLRAEIGTCSAPCDGSVSRSGYSRQVRAVRAFLDGSDDGPLRDLEGQMHAASAALEFEKAAVLRDKYTDLAWLRERLDWLHSERGRLTFVYPLRGDDGSHLWYLVQRGRVLAAVAAPATLEERRAAAAALEAAYGGRRRLDASLPEGQIDHVLIVANWFNKRPEERAAVLEPADALARCRDTAAVALDRAV
jgi:excinuclease ABC subunit C